MIVHRLTKKCRTAAYMKDDDLIEGLESLRNTMISVAKGFKRRQSARSRPDLPQPVTNKHAYAFDIVHR